MHDPLPDGDRSQSGEHAPGTAQATGRLGPIEWATTGRPRPGEQVSGDRAIALGVGNGVDDAALFAVVDGLGHGPEAASAAQTAVEVISGAADQRLEVLIQLCHRVLEGTRGVALTLARVDFAAGKLSWTGVGNVTAHVVAKSVGGVEIRSSAYLAAGIVGYRIPEITPARVVPIRTGDLLVIATDGISDEHLDHLDFAASAPVIAEQILGKHAKETDDATVLTARHRGLPT